MNFVDCHEEKIHISGHVQDFGYLIGLDANTKTIKFFSENITLLYPINKSFLGKTLEQDPAIFSKLVELIKRTDLDYEALKDNEVFLDKIEINDLLYHFSIYRYDGIVFLEFEKVIESFTKKNYISKKYESIHNAEDSEEIWTELISSIHDAIGYDRIMVYRFLDDGSGKVISEKVNDKIESLLHLHYPESDIPRQARALYLKKRKRIFSNVYSEPVPIISNSDEPVDLTYSSIRAMSPVHGQYVKNTGVSSSFSTSIIVDNKLWGLVNCQNVEPKHIDLVNRIRAEVFTVIAANAYSSCKSRKLLDSNIKQDKKIVKLKNKLLTYDNLEESLFSNIVEMQNYPEADGLAIVVKDHVKTSGAVPSLENIDKIIKWAQENPLENFYSTNDFYKLHGEKLGITENAAGLMFGFTDDKRNELLIWFRKEIDGQVLWAGNPSKDKNEGIKIDDDKMVMSPRKSFEIYIENINGKARPWKKKDIYAAQKVVASILETTYIQFRKVQELNEELKNLNEELDSFSYTISHDLGTPLTVMKLNAQQLARSQRDNPEVQKKLASILDEIFGMEMMMRGVLNLSRAKSSEITFEEIPTKEIIHKICEDSKLTLNENVEFDLQNLPNVMADKVMLIQVFLNVIGNAVKYSAKSEHPKVIINGEEKDSEIVYRITDNGIGIPEKSREKLFKIFNRMDNAKSFQGNGVGLSIVCKIMERLGGNIDYESTEEVGTTFILTFKKP